jgi:hypothetical protein
MKWILGFDIDVLWFEGVLFPFCLLNLNCLSLWDWDKRKKKEEKRMHQDIDNFLNKAIRCHPWTLIMEL